MVKENFELLEQPRFEWDEEKSKTNLIKQGIDLEDASEVFYEPILISGSNRNSEGEMGRDRNIP
jgi:uncharacterized protein